MSSDDMAKLDDDALVQYFRDWLVEQGRCGSDADAYTRINVERIEPCSKLFEARGEPALRKLLPLIHDQNPHVRLVAASCCFQLEPEQCRQTLLELVARDDFTSVIALVSLPREDVERLLDGDPTHPDSAISKLWQVRDAPEPFASWSDANIVEWYDGWAFACAEPGRDPEVVKGIIREKLDAAARALDERGSLRDLLGVAQVDEPIVRRLVATHAWDAAPQECRRLLEELIVQGDEEALAELLKRDEVLRAEIEPFFRDGKEALDRELRRRFRPPA